MKKLLIALSLSTLNAFGMNPFFRAISQDDSQKAQELINQDKSIVNSTDTNGWTPLYNAAWYNSKDVAKILLNSGALVNKTTKSGAALHFAAQSGHKQITQLLLDYGAMVNITNESGNTALHLAALNGNKDEAQLLIDAGANPFIQNEQHQTALDRALTPHPHREEDPETRQMKTLIAGALNNYMPTYKETMDNPTATALEKAVMAGSIGLINPLLVALHKREQISPAFISQLGQIAQQHYVSTKKPVFQAIGRVLQDYSRYSRIIRGLSAKEDAPYSPELPQGPRGHIIEQVINQS